MDISQRLKELRINHQLTQEELAKEIFVSRQTISNWENGKVQPDIENLFLLSDFYQLSLDELLPGKLPLKSQPKFLVAQRFLYGYLLAAFIALVCQITLKPPGALIALLFAVFSAIYATVYLVKTHRGHNLYGQGENMYDLGIIMWGLFYMLILVAIALQRVLNGELR